MKKFTFLSLIAFSVFLTSLRAQEPVSVGWSLATDSSVTTLAGNVVASFQNVSAFLAPKRYRTISTDPGWQGKGEGQIYQAAFDPTAYDEYKIKPAPGNSLKITQISFRALGGGTGNMRLAVYYSKDGFATFDSLGGSTSMSGGSGATYNSTNYRATATAPIALLNTSTTGLGTIEMATFPALNITVNPGDSFMVRSYPFLSSASTSTRYYPSKEWLITGTTTSAVAPVTFAGAKAFERNSGVQVEWTSATEVNVSKYGIERSSDGRSFTDAGSVNAVGNSTVAKTYTWYDASPRTGNNYYRVKSIDKDGAIRYTSIMKVLIGKGNSGIVISPNPVRGNIVNLQLKNLSKGVYTLRFVNSAGQQVYTSQLTHDGGSASQVLEIPGLKKGVYNMQVTNGTTRLNNSVIVD